MISIELTLTVIGVRTDAIITIHFIFIQTTAAVGTIFAFAVINHAASHYSVFENASFCPYAIIARKNEAAISTNRSKLFAFHDNRVDNGVGTVIKSRRYVKDKVLVGISRLRQLRSVTVPAFLICQGIAAIR